MKKYFNIVFVIGILLLSCEAYATTSLAYQYDVNGNLISGDGKYYEYNDSNKLVKVRQGDQTGPVIAEYFYDYAEQRVKKTENGVTTYYIGKHYETTISGSGTTNTSYYFANAERVAKKDSAGNMYYYHSDHLGGTNVVTNSSGNMIERIQYYPFGEIREGGNEKYQFTGKERDKLTDNYYYEARYYESDFEHFTQSDTSPANLYDPQNLNRYAYVRNNPIRLVDPTGNFFTEILDWAGGEISAGVDRAVNYASNTSVGNWLGDKTLALVSDPNMAHADPATQAAYYGALAEGLGHTYDVTKKATGKALSTFVDLYKSGPEGVIQDYYDLTVMLAEESGAFSAKQIKLMHTVSDVADVFDIYNGAKIGGGKFHFNRQTYKDLNKAIGSKNYSRLLNAIRDNNLDNAYRIIKTIERSDHKLQEK